MRRFYVAIPKNDGGVELHRMKEWLRQHPEQVPNGFDATSSTAWQLRDALKKKGWTVQEDEGEVRMIMPGTNATMIETAEEVESNESETESGPSFALEFQLRDFLAQNLNAITIGGRKLKLFVDPTGRDGVEFPTAVGPIDILALDEFGDFVVFELKRARSPDHAIGQLARYMGWVKQTIGKDKKVRGAIVAKQITPSLKYAITAIPDTSLFEYEIRFQLTPVS
jgi:hypothetical protein